MTHKFKTRFTALVLTLLLCPISSALAQGNELIAKAKSYLNPSQGLQIEYQLKTDHQGTPSTGHYYALGDAFYLESEEIKAWHDGQGNLWVYLAMNGEVNLTRPQREDLQELNPLLNFDLLSPSRFYLKERREGPLRILTATPKQPKKEYIEWLELQTDAQGKPIALRLRQVGMDETLHLKIIRITQKANKAMKEKDFFSFSPNKLPGTPVIDLR